MRIEKDVHATVDTVYMYLNINPRFALSHVIVLMFEGIKVEMNIE